MKILAGFSAGALVVALSVIACVGDDPAPVTDSDGGPLDPSGCTATQKSCSGTCVSKDDPSTGCGGPACTACAASINAAPSCTAAGACATACNAGFSDCDGDPTTGCEAKSGVDVSNCGACGNVCGSANTDTPTKCAASACVFACSKDFGHCGTDDSLGCETSLLASATNCGACGHSCLGGMCLAGKCQPFQLASASYPSGLAIDAKNVYFTFPAGPEIQRVQRDGKCTPTAPCPQDFAGRLFGDLSGIRGPSPIVSDGTYVFLG